MTVVLNVSVSVVRVRREDRRAPFGIFAVGAFVSPSTAERRAVVDCPVGPQAAWDARVLPKEIRARGDHLLDIDYVVG